MKEKIKVDFLRETYIFLCNKYEKDKSNKNLKREINKIAKQLFMAENKLRKSCSKQGHKFGDWIEEISIEKRQINEPFDIFPSFTDVEHPKCERTCEICGEKECFYGYLNQMNPKFKIKTLKSNKRKDTNSI